MISVFWERMVTLFTNSVHLLLIAAMVALVPVVSFIYGIPVGFAIALVPLMVFIFLSMIGNPFICYTVLFLFNYFLIVLIRYLGVSGLSVVFDGLLILTFLSFMLNKAFRQTRISTTQLRYIKSGYGIIVAALFWAVYCCFELLNPSAMVSIWLLARGQSFYLLLIVVLTFLIFNNFRKVEIFLMILSVVTLIGVAKAIGQQFLGFDGIEQIALDGGLAKTHLLITGTRYFSIYASAAILGAVMGHACVVFLIAAIYTNSKSRRVYFLIVAIGALYALLISGTRGALVIPGAGFLLFAILSKQIRLMVPTILSFVLIYVFLAMTTIGQGYYVIRRARTIFDPQEPSLMVRLENQKLFAEYLKDKPFGEGLGLSGVDLKDVDRFTTSIPTDSWYVKIWVETGIVGLSLHLAILAYIILHGSYIILFQIKNKQIKGVLTGLLCGVFGILVSSYGNQILGQFPIVMIVYSSMALVFMGKFFDSQLTNNKIDD